MTTNFSEVFNSMMKWGLESANNGLCLDDLLSSKQLLCPQAKNRCYEDFQRYSIYHADLIQTFSLRLLCCGSEKPANPTSAPTRVAMSNWLILRMRFTHVRNPNCMGSFARTCLQHSEIRQEPAPVCIRVVQHHDVHACMGALF